jgi:hypothetical protein
VLIFFELTLSRVLDDSLFRNHRIAAAIYFRHRFPDRNREKRLTTFQGFDQCFTLIRHLLAQLRLCRRRPRFEKKVTKIRVAAITVSAACVCATDASAHRLRRIVWYVGFHVSNSFRPRHCVLLRPACCSTQSRFSPSIARSQYSPTNKPPGFCSDRFSTNSLTRNSLTTLSMVSLCS